ncbi:MAG: uroporphyrinogen-III synthase [Thiohalophilus sp.]|uniref:uroporphyrinogen-III synthase n=1 Tax=Thiohalophilus sp. TaxID=3028392 RepID=UPI00287054F0|nr:uroporphyrinogen-III synthase [Thiohalophilus sp.]MDR9437185.1 uroporphyrinogen-III synthase [Thiohalophilus sp.]
MPNDLAGLRVLITRPSHQSADLQHQLEQVGARPLLFPLLAIDQPADPTTAQQALSRVQESDLLIFISPNAVHHALALSPEGLPNNLTLACVGRGTARALEQQTGRAPDLMPQQGHDSEALLALPALQEAQIRGKKVLIVRGEGGREKLATSLRARGAQVEYAEVYRRVTPANDPETLLGPLRRGEIDIISLSSSEALANLLEFGQSEQETLQHTPLVVFHQRIADAARQRGFTGPILVCEQPGDQGLLETLRHWRHAE